MKKSEIGQAGFGAKYEFPVKDAPSVMLNHRGDLASGVLTHDTILQSEKGFK